MERIAKACGGNSVNAVEDLTESDLGYCEVVTNYNYLLVKRIYFRRREIYFY